MELASSSLSGHSVNPTSSTIHTNSFNCYPTERTTDLMPDELQNALQDIALRQLSLSHKVAVWFTLARADPDDARTVKAADLASSEAGQLLAVVLHALTR